MSSTAPVVRTRFAPSPTGYLHVGGARTALFSWLFARKHGGQFLLRIEDTDKARNTAESLVGILEDLRWLGLNWDEGPVLEAVRKGELASDGPVGPYFQSQRDEIYARYFAQLLAAGRAYFAWETPAELEIARKTAVKLKQTYRYQRPARLVTDEAEARRLAGDRPLVLRFKGPDTPIHVDDLVLGPTDFPTEHVDDFVIRKADGGATFHFANVVDDHLMRISHVIRAQEHFNNTPKHAALAEALGFARPAYAHLPVVFNAAGAKMSKRDKDKAVKESAGNWLKANGGAMAALVSAVQATGAARGVPAPASAAELGALLADWLEDKKGVLQDGELRTTVAEATGLPRSRIPEIDVHDFRVSGYLPEVLLNYVALVGWSAGHDREKFTLAELVQAFDLVRVGKTNARFDREKLATFNTQAVNALIHEGGEAGRARLRAAFRDYLSVNPGSPIARAQPSDAVVDEVLAMNEGFRIFRDVDEKTAVLFAPDDAYVFDRKAVDKHLAGGSGAGFAVLARVQAVLAGVADWSAAALEHAVKAYAEQQGLGLGAVAQPIRVAVAGSAVSPPIWPTLTLLGRERTLARIARALALSTNAA